MKIGLDTRTLETGHRFRGIGIYSKNLIKAISLLDKKNEYTFFCQSLPSAASKLINQKDFKYQDFLVRKTLDPSKYNWYLDQIYFPLAIKKSKVDLVHFFEQLSSTYLRPTKTIVSIMDHFQIIGENTTLKNKIKFTAAKNCDKIITISHYIKKELIKTLKIPEEKIAVTHLGYDKDIYLPMSDTKLLEEFRQKKFNGKKYLLWVGSLGDYEKRKNLDFLIEVFIEFSKINQQIQLVLIGKKGQEAERFSKILEKEGVLDRVVFTDFVDTQEIPQYFQAAEVFLFPSLAEGFGLPPLEAMACGTPVISSNTTSLPEVIGDAGILSDPNNKKAWVKSIIELILSKEKKKCLSQKGIEQAKKFSWEKCAKETLEVYEEVYNH